MKDIDAHVEKYGSDNQKKDFEFLTNSDEGKASFFEVKKWFMNEFNLRKELKEYRNKVQSIVECVA